MRIISWNCQMALRNKLSFLLKLCPDILLIPESEHPGKIDFVKEESVPVSSVWIGDNINKGLGIYGINGVIVELHESYADQYKYIAPIKVTYRNLQFLLFAVWAMPCPENRMQRYIGQVYYAMSHYERLISKNSIISGDFNWNLNFDDGKNTANFDCVTKLLASRNICSAYHEYTGQRFGQESQRTFFMYRDPTRSYHIDYCFHGEIWQSRMKSTSILPYGDWQEYSDHSPLVVDYLF